MNYGKNLLKLRQEINLSQADIAKVLEIDHSQYSHYEVEDRTIPLKHLITLCDYFNVSLDYIFNFTNIKIYKDSIKGINKNIAGMKLKEFRKENKLTQEKLASLLITNKSVICKYEKGMNLIATPFLYTICKKYHVSADYLLGKTSTTKFYK